METMASLRQPRPVTFCHGCKQRGIMMVILPDGNTLCLRCIRRHRRDVYQNIVHWVTDHPPIDPT